MRVGGGDGGMEIAVCSWLLLFRPSGTLQVFKL